MANQVKTQSTAEKLKQKAANIETQTQHPAEAPDQSAAPVEKGRTFKDLLNSPSVKARFDEILDQRAGQYLTSILSLYNSDKSIREADPVSVIQAAMIAATVDLPIEKNFGYAWIIAYYDKDAGKKIAQFQMGYRGYIQLALRTGQYEKINVITVYEGELVAWNALTEELVYDPDKRASDVVIGYAAYFKLHNGFVKTIYWTRDQVEKHRVRHNKAQDKQSMNKIWREDYDAMAMKTVLTSLLKRWGILSVEMQKAIVEEETEPERKEINPEFADIDYPFENVPDGEAAGR